MCSPTQLYNKAKWTPHVHFVDTAFFESALSKVGFGYIDQLAKWLTTMPAKLNRRTSG